MQNKNDITGMQFGYWTVLRKDDTHPGSRNSFWICRCKCGTEKPVMRFTLINGASQSCGCKPSEKLKGINSTHGMSDTRIYHEWLSMRRRCRNPNGRFAACYYLKGIRVCEEWDNDFVAFYDWAMANGYADDLTIDRIDNSKGYSPENCRWVPMADQQKNKTNTVYVEYKGEMWCLRTLCIALGVSYNRAYNRYRKAKRRNEELPVDKLLEPRRMKPWELLK